MRNFDMPTLKKWREILEGKEKEFAPIREAFKKALECLIKGDQSLDRRVSGLLDNVGEGSSLVDTCSSAGVSPGFIDERAYQKLYDQYCSLLFDDENESTVEAK